MKELRCAVCDKEIEHTREIHHFRTNAFGDTIIFCSEACEREDAKR